MRDQGASLTKTLSTPLPVVSKDSLIAGKYRIVEEIGRGSMGIVYQAEEIKLQRTVALKFMPPQLTDSPELKERFLIEAQAAEWSSSSTASGKSSAPIEIPPAPRFSPYSRGSGALSRRLR